MLLLIFIVQNDRVAGTSYLGVHGHIPLGVAPLPTAIFGVILVVLCGTATIIQLRIAAHHHRRAGARHAAAAQGQTRPARHRYRADAMSVTAGIRGSGSPVPCPYAASAWPARRQPG